MKPWIRSNYRFNETMDLMKPWIKRNYGLELDETVKINETKN